MLFKVELTTADRTRFDHLKPAVKERRLIEWHILKTLVTLAYEDGWRIWINNGETKSEIVSKADNGDLIQLLDFAMATDEESICFSKGKGNFGVFMVYGNSGYDVMCDWNTPLENEEFFKEAMAVADHYSEQ